MPETHSTEAPRDPRVPRKGAYFITWPQGNAAGPGDGVKRKIGEQIRHWQRLGVNTRLFVLGYQDSREAWEAEVSDVIVRVAGGRWHRVQVLEQLAREVRDFAPDFLYMRQETYYPAVARMMEATPTFVELNGDEVSEARGGPTYYWLYRLLSRELVLRKARGLVAVSGELAQARSFTRFELPTAVIANGIDLSSLKELPVPKNSGIRLGFLGSSLGARWHGVDKIIDLARRRPDWSLDVIGPDISSFGEIPSNVRMHGVLPRKQYEPILAECDVAFGGLSGYVKQANEGSPLKVREYMAYGIPTISGVIDTDFPKGAPFFLLLPNTPDNVSSSIAEIESFALRWKGKRIERSQVSHLDSSFKERQRMEFVARVLARAAGR